MTIKRLSVVLLAVLCTGLLSWSQSGTASKKPILVSLIRVIANPEKFAGRKLRVIGVLGYGGGLDGAVCLYVSEADARNAVEPNCIYVNKGLDRDDKRIGKYVIFNANFGYIAGMDKGAHDSLAFEDVSDIRLWPQNQ